jgi:Domain of unknown function (DUF4276)
MMEHLVFFLEEPSAQDFLEVVLPHILPSRITAHFVVFEGKQDLEKRLIMKLKYWQRPNSQFIVMRDQDSGDCKVIKANLKQLCIKANKPNAIVRIVCKELETFFVGDWAAIAAAYSNEKWRSNARSAKFRNPDLLGSPSAEIKRLIPNYQKRAGARIISPHLDFDKNTSASFQALIRSIKSIA